MGKKGTDGRRTSGITPAQVMEALGAAGYYFAGTSANAPVSTAFRKTVSATQKHLGQGIATSRSGRSVTMGSNGIQVLLPVNGHMTDVALKAIEAKTGVKVSQLTPKIALPR